MCWPRILRLSLSFLFLSVQASNAVLVNQTIDDSLGDSLTGSKVQYSPSTDNRGLVWKSQDACDDCAIVPNLAKAHNNTWNSATNFEGFENITATFHFSGTAIYVYFIIPDVPFGPQIINFVDCDFLLDDQFAGHYTHTSDGSSGFQYHALVYHNTSLNNTPHTFMIQVKGTSVVIFDYAKYTFDTPASSAQPGLPKTELPKSASAISTASAITTTTSATSKASAIVTLSHPSKPAGTIAGGTIAGVVGIALLVLGIILYRRRTLRRTLPNGSPTTPPGSSLQMRRGDITPPMQAQTEFERQSSDSYQEAVALHSWGGYQSPGFLNGQIAAAAKLETFQDTELLKGVKRLEPQRYLADSDGLQRTETRTREGPTSLLTIRSSVAAGKEKRLVMGQPVSMEVQDVLVHAESGLRLTAGRLVRSLPQLPSSIPERRI